MIIPPKKLFLIDCLGALLSAFLVGIILARFESVFGMPREATHWLSIISCLYAVCSFTCFLLITDNWKPYLWLIALANLLYCCLTIYLVVYFYQHLTALGLLYFTGEVMVVIGLAFVELKSASKSRLRITK